MGNSQKTISFEELLPTQTETSTKESFWMDFVMIEKENILIGLKKAPPKHTWEVGKTIRKMIKKVKISLKVRLD